MTTDNVDASTPSPDSKSQGQSTTPSWRERVGKAEGTWVERVEGSRSTADVGRERRIDQQQNRERTILEGKKEMIEDQKGRSSPEQSNAKVTEAKRAMVQEQQGGKTLETPTTQERHPRPRQ